MKEFMKKHKKLWIVLGVIVVVVIAIVIWAKVTMNKATAALAAATTQETAEAERRELVTTVAANGTVVAADSKDVSVNLSGVEFKTVDVEVGDKVNEGDTLCTFDTSSIEQKIEDTEKTKAANEASASLNVSSAERMLAEAEASRDLAAEQSDIDIANAWQDYLRSLTDVEEAEDTYNAAVEKSNSKDAELNRVYTNLSSLEDYEVYFATVSGQLNDYLSQNGVTCTAGLTPAIATDNWLNLQASNNSGTNGILSDYQKLDGTALTDTNVITQINNYLTTLKQVHYAYASYVSSGSNADSTLSSWQTKAESAQSSEDQAKSSYESAVKTSQSYLKTYQQKVRDKQTTANSNDSTVNKQEDSLKSNQISASTVGLTEQETIDSYEKQLEKCTVTAPISGTVTAVKYNVGDGYNGGTIVTIEDETAYQISAEIEEYDIGKIKLGQDVVIKTNGTNDEELEGRVAEIAEHATSGSTSSTTTYNVKIDLLSKNDAIKLDMTAKVSIIIDRIEDALTVPYDAVQTDDDGNDYVEVVTDSSDTGEAADSSQAVTEAGEPSANKGLSGLFGSNNNMPEQVQTKKVYITRGAESDYYIQVESDDLKEGDEVIVVSEESNSLEDLMNEMGAMGGF